ncbi:MAG: hypothetical protein JOZ23_13790 [Mycobacterium sp.]|nr:hypothetical protein [Mycobacterium sp.]
MSPMLPPWRLDAEAKHMMMSSDGSRIYVTGYDGSLSIIDPIAMTAKTIGVPRNAAAASARTATLSTSRSGTEMVSTTAYLPVSIAESDPGKYWV